MSCCNRGLTETFTEDVSRKDANRYRRKGLPPRARKLVDAIESRVQFQDNTTLEIGVGAGGVTVEMLKRGAMRATGVDAVATQLAAARSLAADFNVGDRLELVLADFTAASDVQHADIVVMDRVICCYADWQALLASAARHADTLIAMTYPRDVWFMRLTKRVMNFSRWVIRSDFRFHVHSPLRMREQLSANGFEPAVNGRYFGWEILTAVRVARP